MARRRVNTRFLIILTLVVVIGGLTAVVFQQVVLRKSPQEFIESAERLLEEKQYEEAVRHFAHAITRSPRDADLLVRYGDVLYGIAHDDPENLRRAVGAWNGALEIDPRHLPALERMLQLHLDESEMSRRPDVFRRVREMAERVVAVDPQNRKARAAQHIAIIQVWLAGVETNAAEIDASLEALAALREQDPADAEIPFYIAQAWIQRGREHLRVNERQRGEALLARAEELFGQVLTEQPESAMAHHRASLTMSVLAQLTRDEQERARRLDRALELADRAVALTQPQDRRFAEVHLAAADRRIQKGDHAGAEQIYRDLLAKRPHEQSARLALATLLGNHPSTREEAIKLLSQPIVLDERVSGFDVLNVDNLETQTIYQLTNLRIDQYPLTDPSEKEALMKRIKEGQTRVENRIGGSARALKLQGKLQQLEGKHIEAIQLFSRAMSLNEQQGGRPDYDLMYLLAKAYYTTQQTGQAKSLLNEMLRAHPGFHPARMLMAQLLLRENAIDEALPHMEHLEQQFPDDPIVLRLRMATLDLANQRGEAEQYYSRLPERHNGDRFMKAQAAMALDKQEEAIRLLRAILEQNPADADAALLLVQVYVSSEQTEQAREVVAAARQASPNHQGLEFLEKQLSDATPQELMDFRRQAIMATPDELTRELRLLELATQSGDQEQALQHLRNAERINPDDGRVMDLMFQYHVQQRGWDKAAESVEKLAQINQDQAGGLLYRFRLAMARQQVDQAVTHAREMTRQYPEFARSWLSLGQALQASGDFDQAIVQYTLAVEKQTDSADALRGLVECSYALGRPADAGRFIAQGRRVLPNHPYFREQEVNYELSHGDPEKALPHLEAVHRENPDSPGNWRAIGAGYLRTAQVKAAASQPQAAQEYLQKSFDAFREGIKRWPDDRSFYRHLSDVILLTGDVDQAEGVLQQLAARDSQKDAPEPQLLLAEFYAKIRRPEQAEAALREALAKAGGAVEIQQRLAGFLAQQERVDDALVVLQENPDNAEIQKQRVEILLTSGRLADAEQSLRESLQRDPNSADLLAMLGFVHLNSQRVDDALQTVNEALRHDPQNLNALYYRGLIRLQQPEGDTDAALADLQQVRSRQPNRPEVRTLIAEAHLRKNDLNSGIREFQAVLQMVPQNVQVRMRLVDLLSSSNPPRWGEVERLLREAQNMPELKDDPQWPHAEARMWVARNDARRAVEKAQQAVRLAPDNPALVQAYLDVLLQTRNYRPVVEETTRLLQQHKDVWWLHQMRAVALRNLGRRDEALAGFEAALAATEGNDAAATAVVQSIAAEIGADEALARIVPRAQDDVHWQLLAARLYQAKQDSANAILMVEKGLEKSAGLPVPQQAAILRLAGGIYLTATPEPRIEQAKQAYIQLLDLVPDDLAALNNLAYLLAENVTPRRPDQALVYSQRAFDLMQRSGNNEPMIMDTHGWVLTLAGRVDEGISLLRQVVDRQPFPEAHYHLAEAYLKRSYAEEARHQLVRAGELLDKARQESQQGNPDLQRKIDDAMFRAEEMIRSQSEARAS